MIVMTYYSIKFEKHKDASQKTETNNSRVVMNLSGIDFAGMLNS